ncbi:4-aminobutyrate aminotransferase [Amphibacillus marinus]|uniref:alanine--glyoxylate transaminase n=1 Tax=Amphibacillus marinus TaxID=872970 RepID=A0A1H8L6D1_9BACI|nr:aspartate aminotransferase family protein [Amphibacillus marinus]SEO00641.1 4-aminobutyrate aminotransferase [Amphibacillus marinus]
MYSIGPKKILEKRQTFLMPATAHFYRQPPQIVSGSMQYLYDQTGKQYVDFFAGVSVMNCGHSNPEIFATAQKQLTSLQHTSTIYLTQPIVDLAEKLAELLPGELKKTFFCVTGSEANEGALSLARLYTKKKGFIALSGGLHGRTHLAMSVTGIPMWRLDDQLVDDQIYFVDRPHNLEIAEIASMATSLAQLEQTLEEHGENIAAMILEPIQGNGGIIRYPKGFLKRVHQLLKEHNVLLIVDEVQTGYGRTGKFFAVEHEGVTPDILVTAKALGNGIPISTFSTTDQIATAFNRPSASTFGANPVAAETALRVLDYIAKHDLVQRAYQLGQYLKGALWSINSPLIKDIRGIGLMLGVEIQALNTKISAADLTDDILEEMKVRGFLIGKNGLDRNVLAFQPPLVIEREDIDQMLAALTKVLASKEAELACK